MIGTRDEAFDLAERTCAHIHEALDDIPLIRSLSLASADGLLIVAAFRPLYHGGGRSVVCSRVTRCSSGLGFCILLTLHRFSPTFEKDFFAFVERLELHKSLTSRGLPAMILPIIVFAFGGFADCGVTGSVNRSLVFFKLAELFPALSK